MANALFSHLRGALTRPFCIALWFALVSLAGCLGTPKPSDSAEFVQHAVKVVTAPAQLQSGLYRGTIGSKQVDMTLRMDAQSSDSLHGSYVEQDGPKAGSRVLLAGEIEDDELSMEESRNGTDVSGHFNASIDAHGFSGQWSDTRGEQVVDVIFKRINQDPPP